MSERARQAYKLAKRINGLHDLSPTEKTRLIERLQQVAVKAGNWYLTLDFAKLPGGHNKALQQTVQDSGPSWVAYQFAKFCPEADMTQLARTLIQNNESPDWFLEMAMLPGANVPLLQQAFVKNLHRLPKAAQGHHLALFATRVQGADGKKLRQVAIDTGTFKEFKRRTT